MSGPEADVNILGFKKKERVEENLCEPPAPLEVPSDGSEGNPGDQGGDGPPDGGDGGGDDPAGDPIGDPSEDDLASIHSSGGSIIPVDGTLEQRIATIVRNLNRNTDKFNHENEAREAEYKGLEQKLNDMSDKIYRAEEIRKRKENFSLDPVIPAPKCYEDSVFDKTLPRNRNQLKDLWHIIPLFDPKSKWTYKISTFLHNCNRAQEECKLNKAEFLNQMRGRVTGSLTEQFDYWIMNNHDPSRIYYDLYQAYCVDVSSEEATQILATYRVSKQMDFNSTCEEIARLAAITAQRVPELDAREIIINSQYRNALLARMPDTLSEMIQEIGTEYRINYDRTATAVEIQCGMQRHLDKIAKVFHTSKIYHYDNRKAFEILNKNKNKEMGRGDNSSNANAKHLNETRAEKTPKVTKMGGYKGEKKVKVVQVTQPRSGANNMAGVGSQGRTFEVNVLHTICGSAHPGIGRANILVLEESRVRNGHRADKGRKYCVFCSSFSHTGAEGCDALYTDSLAKAVATPSQKSCDNCQNKLKKDLHHPSRLCPLRPAMLSAYKRGVIAPVGIFKYFLNKTQSPRA